MSITKVTDAGLDKSRIVTPLIINGDMSVAQRATSATGLGATSGYNTCDRWKLVVEGSPSARFTQTQSTDVPTGEGFTTSLKMDCTTAAGSPDADDALGVQTLLEAQDLQLLRYGTSSAKKITLSFWVNATKTGTHAIWIYQNDDARSQAQTYTVNTTNTWEKKTVVFAADTTGVIDDNNGEGFRITWWITTGTNRTSGTLATTWQSHTNANVAVGQVNNADSTDNNWYITGVQMEIGEFDTNTIPDFPFENHDSNLHKCQRYFYKLGGVADKYKRVGTCITNPNNRNQTAGFYYLPNSMRAEPTVTISGSSSGVYIGGENSYSSFAGSMESANDSKNLSVLRFAGTLSGNSGNHCLENNLSYSGTGFMSADAEL